MKHFYPALQIVLALTVGNAIRVDAEPQQVPSASPDPQAVRWLVDGHFERGEPGTYNLDIPDGVQFALVTGCGGGSGDTGSVRTYDAITRLDSPRFKGRRGTLVTALLGPLKPGQLILRIGSGGLPGKDLAGRMQPKSRQNGKQFYSFSDRIGRPGEDTTIEYEGRIIARLAGARALSFEGKDAITGKGYRVALDQRSPGLGSGEMGAKISELSWPEISGEVEGALTIAPSDTGELSVSAHCGATSLTPEKGGKELKQGSAGYLLFVPLLSTSVLVQRMDKVLSRLEQLEADVTKDDSVTVAKKKE